MRVLVTGACGFVGGHLIEHLRGCGDAVRGTVLPTLAHRTFPCPVEPLDVTDGAECHRIIAAWKPDIVYHLAGMAFAPEAEEDLNRTLAINVGGVMNVFKACHDVGHGATVLLVSSSDMYGRVSPEQLPLDESSPVRPATSYGLSKLMAELVPGRFTQFGRVRGVIARPFNHIGPGQNERFVVSNFARQVALIAAGKAPPVMYVGNLDARRDFSDVRDIVRGYRLAALKGEGLYTFCRGTAVSIRSLLDELVRLAGVDVRIEIDPARLRPAETPEIVGSYAHAERELGWRPMIPLAQSLADIYAAWRHAVT